MTDTTGVATFEDRLADRSTWRTGEACPIVRALDIVGTRSALLIIREAFYGTTRFDDFTARIEITEAVAAARLRDLTAAGLFVRVPYKEPGQRTRHEYRLTLMGRDLAPAIIGLYQWGGAHLSPGGRPPLALTHEACGTGVSATLVCECGDPVEPGDIRIIVSPGASRSHREESDIV